MKALLIVDKRYGVYLGNCSGIALWSKRLTMGMTHALTFPTVEHAIHFVQHHIPPGGMPSDVTLVRVEADCQQGNVWYASHVECCRVGHGWLLQPDTVCVGRMQ